jgi:hypothetical protein
VLWCAVERGHVGVARLLLDGGADPELGSGTLSRGRVFH